MSEDIVNQITLSYLISKSQLEKLNKKHKPESDYSSKHFKETYKGKIIDLFNNLIDNKSDIYTEEIKNSFNIFIEKSIYYLKMINNDNSNDNSNECLESNEEQGEEIEEQGDSNSEELEEQEDSNSEELEEQVDSNSEELEEQELEEQEDSNEEEEQEETKKINISQNSMEKIPFDWFKNVKQRHQLNQIMPRNKSKL
jgi:hypothetical protein